MIHCRASKNCVAAVQAAKCLEVISLGVLLSDSLAARSFTPPIPYGTPSGVASLASRPEERRSRRVSNALRASSVTIAVFSRGRKKKGCLPIPPWYESRALFPLRDWKNAASGEFQLCWKWPLEGWREGQCHCRIVYRNRL